MQRKKRLIKKPQISLGIFGMIGLVGVLLATIMAITILSPSSYAANNEQKPEVKQLEPPKEPTKEISREWNWKKADVNLDNMHRE